MLDDVAHLVLFAHTKVKAIHWATTSYAVHKATDELAEDIARHGDLLVEALSGLLGMRVSARVAAAPLGGRAASSRRRSSAAPPAEDSLRSLIDATVAFLTTTFDHRLAEAAIGVSPSASRRPRTPGSPTPKVTPRRSDERIASDAARRRFAPLLSVRDELVLAMAKARYNLFSFA